MSLNQLKRALWMVNEIVSAGSHGVSLEELCASWETSRFNDKKGAGPLTERTFYRLRRDIESIFDININCTGGREKRYYAEDTDHSTFIRLFVGLITDKAKYDFYLDQLLLQVMKGNEITAKEKTTIEKIAFKLGRTAFEALGSLIKDACEGNMAGVDHAEWARLRYHTYFWYDPAYLLNNSWVGVGIDRHGPNGTGIVKFYIGNESDDTAFHSRLMKEFDLLAPEKLDDGYLWFAPRDPDIHTMTYTSQPDFAAIKSRIEALSLKLNTILP